MRIALAVVQFAVLFSAVHGHARLTKPPSRATMWRYDFPNPKDTNDQGRNCGGVQTQWNVYGGKCGICGDSYGDNPRAHEVGGKYANGIIVATYKVGETIDVGFYLTANHLGYAEFRLCQNNDPKAKVKQDCFEKNLLELESGGTKFAVDRDMKEVAYKIKLPANVKCDACVLQWRYRAGNNWGKDPVTGEQGKGFGPQETFQACADIAIEGKVDDSGNTNTPVTVPEENDDETEEVDDLEEDEDEDDASNNAASGGQCNCVDIITPAMCHNVQAPKKWSNRH